jgi:hypothetical protein
MPLGKCALFLMEDSSSSNDSDLKDILFDDDEQLLLTLAAKELEDDNITRRTGSKTGRLCIPQNRMLGHAMLMQDYFSDDIYVLQRSHIFSNLVSDKAPACNYTVNGHEYNM